MELYRIREELRKGGSIYDLPLRVTFYARVSTEVDAQLKRSWKKPFSRSIHWCIPKILCQLNQI